jgi:hypothetical protein
MPVFAGIPRQSGAGKSRDLRLHAGSFAHRRDGTRLLNFVAALTTKVDLFGPSQICNRAFAEKSPCRIDIFDAPALPFNDETTGCPTAGGENAEEECQRLGQALALFPYLHGTAIWLSIQANFLECAISHA